jgi:hypothetical protein
MQKRRSYILTRGTTLFDNETLSALPMSCSTRHLCNGRTRSRLLEELSPRLLGGGVIVQNRRCLSPADSSLWDAF